MWGRLIQKLAGNDNAADISFMDVKALYDAAYAENVNSKKFNSLMAKAAQLDELYRAQLVASQAFKYGRAA